MSVDVALIDSGVNPWHSHVCGVEGGTAFRLSSSGEVVESDDFRDEIGHGTALAGIIRERIPDAKLYALKIFWKDLNAPFSVLLAALGWAIDRKIKIVNLSLGTKRIKDRDRLQNLCKRAFDNNIVIVAAAGAPDDLVFPSSFETVIGVYWNRQCDETSLIYHPANNVEFGAYGRPRALPGLQQEHNLSGSSFASAHVAAKAAQLLERNGNRGIDWIREMLAGEATKEVL
jgi:subtilisin family serine protease